MGQRKLFRETMPDMMEVTGFDITRCELGRRLVLRRDGQREFYRSLCTQLKVMDLTDRIRVCDLSSLDSVYLITSDGYYVHLGGTSELHQKLRSMTLVLEWIAGQSEAGYTGGTIEVSIPGEPTFQPN